MSLLKICFQQCGSKFEHYAAIFQSNILPSTHCIQGEKMLNKLVKTTIEHCINFKHEQRVFNVNLKC